MSQGPTRFLQIIVTPSFNLAATMGFIDPFRAANYLEGQNLFGWSLVSEDGGNCRASNGVEISTLALRDTRNEPADFVIVSSSWTPEIYGTSAIQSVLHHRARQDITLGCIDTGAFVLARAGLLQGRQTTVHYEHTDAFKEMFPEVQVTENICEFDGPRISCCGGVATTDFALHIIRNTHGTAIANAAARYVFHADLRDPNTPQNPPMAEPLGKTVPPAVRKAIAVMEAHLYQRP